MNYYNEKVRKELVLWQRQMQRSPSIFNNLTKKLQTRINKLVPEKVHSAITATIKQMIKGVLFGAGVVTAKPQEIKSLELTEAVMLESIDTYKKTAAAEGGITGAGGILMSFADFPLLIGIKIKMLFDIASRYGFDVSDYKERIFLLHIFQLAFSSHEHRKNVYLQMTDWKKTKVEKLPDDINQFEWRSFQQEYRDYIDLAKLAQMIPIIGAAVGLVVNYRLLQKLAHTAMNAYRMRLLEEDRL